MKNEDINPQTNLQILIPQEQEQEKVVATTSFWSAVAEGNKKTTVSMMVGGGIVWIIGMGGGGARLGEALVFSLSVFLIIGIPLLVSIWWSSRYYRLLQNNRVPLSSVRKKAIALFFLSLVIPALWMVPGAIYTFFNR